MGTVPGRDCLERQQSGPLGSAPDPGGTRERYRDALGRPQWRVVSPAGTLLVTRGSEQEWWQVWWSDSLATLHRGADLERCLIWAEQRARTHPDPERP